MYLEIILNTSFFVERDVMGFAETLKALSDPVRREILELLKTGRMSAGDIGGHFDMTGATISYHLKILKNAGLIFEEREKNYIYYSLNASILEELLLWLSRLMQTEAAETASTAGAAETDMEQENQKRNGVPEVKVMCNEQ